MRIRKRPYGTCNTVGARVEMIRKSYGMKQKDLLALLKEKKHIEMSYSNLSKLEGQHRGVTDLELVALAEVLDVSIYQLLGRDEA